MRTCKDKRPRTALKEPDWKTNRRYLAFRAPWGHQDNHVLNRLPGLRMEEFSVCDFLKGLEKKLVVGRHLPSVFGPEVLIPRHEVFLQAQTLQDSLSGLLPR